MKVILTQKVVAVLDLGGLRTGNKTALVDSGVFNTSYRIFPNNPWGNGDVGFFPSTVVMHPPASARFPLNPKPNLPLLGFALVNLRQLYVTLN